VVWDNPRVRVLANGMYSPRSSGTHRQHRERLARKVPESACWKKIVLYYGRMHPKKGVDLLVAGFEGVAREFPDVGLLIAAIPQDKAYGRRIERLARDSQVSERIHVTTGLLGTESLFLLEIADVFALTAHDEGLPMAVVEALAYGCPMLVTEGCNIPVIADGGAGVVIEPSVAAIERGLRHLLSLDRTEISQMRDRSRSVFDEYFTWERVGATLEALYLQAMSDGTREVH
jgi:glycosyltransferase involved in cell wall biosynthesis